MFTFARPRIVAALPMTPGLSIWREMTTWPVGVRSVMYPPMFTIRARSGAETLPLTDSVIRSVVALIVMRLRKPCASSVVVSLTRMPRSFATNSAFTMLTGICRIGSSSPFKMTRVTNFMFGACAISPP